MAIRFRGAVTLSDVAELKQLTEIVAQHLSTQKTIGRNLAGAIAFLGFETSSHTQNDEVLLAWADAVDDFVTAVSGPGSTFLELPREERPRRRMRSAPKRVAFAQAILGHFSRRLSPSRAREERLRAAVSFSQRFLALAQRGETGHVSRIELDGLYSDIDGSDAKLETGCLAIQAVITEWKASIES